MTDATSNDLWEVAYKSLQQKEPRLVRRYELLLESKSPLTTDSMQAEALGTQRLLRLSALITQSSDGGSIPPSIMSRSSKTVKSSLEKIASIVKDGKYLIASAVTAEPHVALAWAGVCLLLPLLLNHFQQNSDAIAGLEKIASIIRIYNVRARKYIGNENKFGRIDFENTIVKLYTAIFNYEIRLVCHKSQSALSRYAQNLRKATNWMSYLSEIIELDKECSEITSDINDKQTELQWEEQLAIYRDRRNISEQLLDIAKRTEKQSKQYKAEKYLQTLRSTNYEYHKDLNNPPRLDGSCKWFLEHDSFVKWREARHGILWISAQPGCGKSVLTRALIDEQLLGPKNLKTCYFFFKSGQEDYMLAANAICAFLHQLVKADGALVDHVTQQIDEDKESIRSNLPVLWEMFHNISLDPRSGSIICVLDGLDEATQQSREDILDKIYQFVQLDVWKQSSCPEVKFLLTSRPWETIENKFTEIAEAGQAFPVFQMRGESSELINQISKEIDVFIEHEVSKLCRVRKFPSRTEDLIKRYLRRSENRTYLWVNLILKHIKTTLLPSDEATEVLKILEKLPQSVEETYDAILMTSPDKDKALILLQLVVAARRPLSIDELKFMWAFHALDPLRPIPSTRNALCLGTNARFAVFATNLCGFILTVSDSRAYLIHPSARDFLTDSRENCSEDATASSRWKGSIKLHTAHSKIGKICVHYLRSDMFHLDYVAHYGGSLPRHLRRRSHYPSIHALREARHVDTTVYPSPEYPYFTTAVSTEPAHQYMHPPLEEQYFSTAHSRMRPVDRYVSFDGGAEETHRPASDPDRDSPLTQDLDLDFYGLGRDSSALDLDGVTHVTQRPLDLALLGQTYEIGKELVLPKAGESSESAMLTFLKYACCYWAEHVRRGTENDEQTICGILDLCHQASEKFRLWYQVYNAANPYWHPINAGQLSILSFFGLSEAIKTYLGFSKARDSACINKTDHDGMCALSWATIQGFPQVTELLLQVNDIDVNLASPKGFTPLLFAAEHGRSAVTKQLLKQPGINPRPIGGAYGWTPFVIAANNHHPHIMAYLVEHNGKSGEIDHDFAQDCARVLEFQLPWLTLGYQQPLYKAIQEIAYSIISD